MDSTETKAPKAYAQWVHMVIHNDMGSGDLSVSNVKINWGKYYSWPDKDAELATSGIAGQTIKPGGGTFEIASCGRENSPSGCEGSFELFDGDVRVCKVYFNCPWGSKHNDFDVSGTPDDYIVQAEGANMDGGAIGTVDIKVAKLG
ncbi:aegerolysin type hemolysin [Whalleya microplaca]|nr:aegerolysin type hemolysin [Whalleya microplaca]